jgi:hypothetical protein
MTITPEQWPGYRKVLHLVVTLLRAVQHGGGEPEVKEAAAVLKQEFEQRLRAARYRRGGAPG